MAEKILVTGGAGFIGSHLVDALLKAGHSVRVLDNLEPQVHGRLREQEKWPDYCNPETEYILGDVRDRNTLEAVIKNIDIIYHFAATTGVGQSMCQIAKYFEVNVQGTANLLDVLANEKNQVERLILSSSRAIHGEGLYTCDSCGPVHPPVRSPEQLDAKQWEVTCPSCRNSLTPLPTPEDLTPNPGSMYAITKLSQEQMLTCFRKAYQLPVIILRFFNVYGPRQAFSNPYTGIITIFIQRLLNQLAPEVYEDGVMSRDFVYISDVIKACQLTLRHECPSGAYNIGSGETVSILQMAQTLTESLAPHLEPQIVGHARVGDIRHCSAELQKSMNVLGYQPDVRVGDGLGQLIDQIDLSVGQMIAEQANTELAQMGLQRR